MSEDYMADHVHVWRRCMEDGCDGERLPAATECTKCWAHADESDLAVALRELGESGHLNANGVHITGDLLERLLSAAPHEDGQAVLAWAEFKGATFENDARFDGVTFYGQALFDGAAFQGQARFKQATFHDHAGFEGATFHGTAGFAGATFHGWARFAGATFHDLAMFQLGIFHEATGFRETTFHGWAEFSDAAFAHGVEFDRAIFEREVWFRDASFNGGAWFHAVTFQNDAVFERATFRRGVQFHEATFGGDTGFGGAIFRGDVTFAGATFEQTRSVGPLLAYRGLVLDDARFAQPVRIEASAPGLCCRRARFSGGVQLWLRWARVVLDDTDLSAPTILAGIPRLTDDRLAEREQQIARAWRRVLTGEISERPRLLSLRRANVAGLGLSRVDLTDCRFANAHNLDKLRMEDDVTLAIAAARLRWDWRQVIAEERTWRTQRSSRWAPPWWPDWADEPPAILETGEIAGLYRALRKSREDTNDQPGAADFYYGEMEMRRHARRKLISSEAARDSGGAARGQVERGILTIYWLVSGYGLRAWRALACLAAVIAGFAVALHLTGFIVPPQPASYWTSLLYALRATLSLTDAEVKLTAWGRLLQALLRLTGPVLLGLALLALRNRVKR